MVLCIQGEVPRETGGAMPAIAYRGPKVSIKTRVFATCVILAMISLIVWFWWMIFEQIVPS